MSARQVAEEVASFLHILSVEDGNARPLVVSVLIAGTARTFSTTESNTLSLQSAEEEGGANTLTLKRRAGSQLGSTRSCLYKVDSAGVMREFAAATTGGLVSDDLRFLSIISESKEASGSGEDGDEAKDNEKEEEEEEEKEKENGMLAKLSDIEEWPTLTAEEALARLASSSFPGSVSDHVSAAL